MTAHTWQALGALLAAVGVGLGAFGAHGLDNYLQHTLGVEGELLARRLAQFDTGVRYQLWHALGIILASLALAGRSTLAAALFLAGIVLFSGMLYVLVLTGKTWLGAIVPLGGVAFIAGWVVFAVQAFREQVVR